MIINAINTLAKITFNHEEIGKKLKGISKIKLFVNKYGWNEINYISRTGNWKKFDKSNPTIVLNDLCVKKWLYIPPVFQNTTQIMKDDSFF